MRRLRYVPIILACLILLLPSRAPALSPIAPSLDGNVGVLRTLSAKSLIGGGTAFYFGGSFFKSDGNYLNTDDILMKRFEGRVSVDYGLTDWLELALGTRSGFAQLQGQDGKPVSPVLSNPDDIFGSLKFSYAADAGLAVGLEGFVLYHSNPDLFGWSNYASYGGRFLWTIDMDAARDVPFRFHLNLGYKADQSHKMFLTKRYGELAPQVTAVDEGALYSNGLTQSLLEAAYGIYNDDQVLGAVAIEIPTPYLTTFVEYSTEQVMDNDQNAKAPGGAGVSPRYNTNPQRITPGLRFTPVPSWTFDVGVDISLTKDITLSQPVGINASAPSLPGNSLDAGKKIATQPLWRAFVGLSYTYIPGAQVVMTREVAPPPPTTGKVSGMVTDAASGLPLGNVIISFPGRALTNLASDPQTGTYTTYDLEEGPVAMTATRDGYEETKVTAAVQAGLTITQDIAMRKLLQYGAIAGTVKDTEGKPLAAVLSFDKPDVSPGATNPADGSYFIKLAPGEYQVTAAAQGFSPQTRVVTIKDRIKTIVEFVLAPTAAPPPPPPLKPAVPEKKPRVFIQKKKIVITETIHFQTGKAKILPDSYSLLNEVAEVIKNNPGIRVRIEGHTDSVGSAALNLKLSEARADAVLKYLVSQEVDPNRLESKGYGSTNPIADNSTAEGRAKNRRVEFTIISSE